MKQRNVDAPAIAAPPQRHALGGLRDLGASAVIKNSNADTGVGAARGDLRIKAANGIAVDVAHAGVEAKAANGDVLRGEVARGSGVLETRIAEAVVWPRDAFICSGELVSSRQLARITCFVTRRLLL